VYRVIGRPELAEDPDYMDPIRRQARGDEIDGWVAAWIRERTLDEAMKTFEEMEVAAAPIYDAQQLLEDEHSIARGTFITVDDPDLGPVRVQAPIVKMSATPGQVRHLAHGLGADNDAVYRELLGLSAERLAELRTNGVI
jgi:crotonobetainyl-CoA:carnitine CoA-transferase CaiB-like acyl-CoA transferase